MPHTWGIGAHAEHEGLAWYWETSRCRRRCAAGTLELQFGATFYKARVFVNGALVGEHEGGHTAWRVDVTKTLGAGGLIAVEIDNRPGLATIPGWAMRLEGGGNVWYDWWHYGGIVRDVALVAQERGARSAARRSGPSVAARDGHGRALRVSSSGFAAGVRLMRRPRCSTRRAGRSRARAGRRWRRRAGDGAARARRCPSRGCGTSTEPNLYRLARSR